MEAQSAEGVYTIEMMTRQELDTICSWWAHCEQTNPGTYDASVPYGADPGGFLMGKLNGEPISCISVVKHGESYGHLGNYFVRPEYRGKGYGFKIWQVGVARLEGRTIVLYGLIAQVPNYKKSGFESAYVAQRFQTVGGGSRNSDPDVRQLTAVDFKEVSNYDADFFPENRSGYLNGWINMPYSTALGIQSHGQLVGFGVLRTSHEGFRIGPLYANTAGHAERLLVALLACADEGASVCIDVPGTNSQALELVKRFRMEKGFDAILMSKGNKLNLPVERLYGISSLEFSFT